MVGLGLNEVVTLSFLNGVVCRIFYYLFIGNILYEIGDLKKKEKKKNGISINR